MNEQLILDLYKNRKYEITPEQLLEPVYVAENASCGDKIVFFRNDEEQTFRYSAQACSLTVASAEYIARKLFQEPTIEISLLQEQLLGDFEMTIHDKRAACVLLPISAIQGTAPARTVI